MRTTAVKSTEGGERREAVPSSTGKEEEVRTKMAMMVALAVVLVALLGGTGGAALARTIGG